MENKGFVRYILILLLLGALVFSGLALVPEIGNDLMVMLSPR